MLIKVVNIRAFLKNLARLFGHIPMMNMAGCILLLFFVGVVGRGAAISYNAGSGESYVITADECVQGWSEKSHFERCNCEDEDLDLEEISYESEEELELNESYHAEKSVSAKYPNQKSVVIHSKHIGKRNNDSFITTRKSVVLQV